MNIETIHEALNFLDDDLIEEVDKLRSHKVEAKAKQPKNNWIAIAACFCFLGISLYVAKDLWLNRSGDKSAVANKEEDGMLIDEGVHESDEENLQNATIGETIGNTSNDNMSVKMEEAYIEILSWQEDGFEGRLKNSIDADIITEGKKVFVKIDVEVSKEQRKLFSTGTVLVKYQATKEERDANDNSLIRYTIFAEEIELVSEE